MMETIIIYNNTIKIIEWEFDDLQKEYGGSDEVLAFYCQRTRTINICSSMNDDAKKDLIFHEAIHALLNIKYDNLTDCFSLNEEATVRLITSCKLDIVDISDQVYAIVAEDNDLLEKYNNNPFRDVPVLRDMYMELEKYYSADVLPESSDELFERLLDLNTNHSIVVVSDEHYNTLVKSIGIATFENKMPEIDWALVSEAETVMRLALNTKEINDDE